jgi:hypothetical protein
MNDFATDHPGVRLNEFIEEDVQMPVMTPVVDEKNGRIEFKQEMKTVKQKTMYVDSKATKVICNAHVYVCVNKGKYHFKCTKCDWNRIAPPVTFKFNPETGILSYRENGIRV